MISAQTLSTIRTILFALGGLVCGGYALAALTNINNGNLPHWMPLSMAICVAVIFFISALLAGQRNTQASLDESYKSDQKTAAGVGFWVALLVGTALWLLRLGGDLQLAITLTSASAAFFTCHVLLELRGR